MSKYSLINVCKEKDGYVDGTWIQDSIGSFAKAVRIARDTEKANSNRIIVAVVNGLSAYIPDYSLLKHLKRLDKNEEENYHDNM